MTGFFMQAPLTECRLVLITISIFADVNSFITPLTFLPLILEVKKTPAFYDHTTIHTSGTVIYAPFKT